MSEFTKEELIIIREGLLWRDAHILPSQRPVKLQNKIESLLDNYCEHTWTEGGGTQLYCTKCHIFGGSR
jgi:hypothetical protein